MAFLRRTLCLALASACLAATATATQAQSSGKPLKILVGYPAGGAVDVVARQLGEELRASGYAVIIENRTGAAGQLATLAMLQAPADGSTLVLMPTGNVSIFQHVYPNLKYNLRDLAPIATVSSFNFGLAVGPAVPARNLKEFIAWAKANPGKANYGTPGAGTGMHFMGVMLGREAGFDFQHVPYRGGAAATADLMGGSIASLATTLPNLVSMHNAGKLRILAFTGEAPLARLPGVPTFAQEGFPNLVIEESFAVFASAKTPQPVLAELESAVMAAARKPRMTESLAKLEFESKVLDSKATLAAVEAGLRQWGPVIKASGYKVED